MILDIGSVFFCVAQSASRYLLPATTTPVLCSARDDKQTPTLVDRGDTAGSSAFRDAAERLEPPGQVH